MSQSLSETEAKVRVISLGSAWQHMFPWGSSDGHGAGDDFVLQHDADHEENKIKHEHEEAEQLAHFPLARGDGDDDKDKHEEEQDDGTEQAVTAHCHWLQVVKCREEQPREGQTDEKGQKDNQTLEPIKFP